MAYETELSNSAKVTNVLSDGISAALVQNVVALPHVYAEDLPRGTMIKLWRKDGSLTAEAVSETSAYTPSASSELTQSTITATVAKTVCVSKLTVEAEQFGNIDLSKLAVEQGKAIARKLDADVVALFAGIATTVTASSILTVADVLQAAYSVRASLAGGIGAKLRGIFDYKGVFEIQKELLQSGGAALTNPELITLLTGLPQLNGYVGSLPGVDIYQTSGLPLSTSDDTGCVFNPETCFAGMYSPSVTVKPTWIGTAGFLTEVASYVFSSVVEWNDLAGCRVLSDT
jgi:hypothetical protein